MASSGAEWLVEQGIGEERAVLIENGTITAARLHWSGRLTLGQVADAVVEELQPHGVWRRFGLVRFANGERAYASHMPREITEGATTRLEITRESLAERGRLKLAQATDTEKPLRAAPTLAEQLADDGYESRVVERFPPDADWAELFLEAWSGEIDFSGGGLILSDTPAMTLIDVDLRNPVQALFSNGLPAIYRTLKRFNITGNIGIDFPTLDKSDRKAIDDRLAQLLQHWPHERTAMNGFGFVQIVARMGQPSMLQRIGRDRTGAAARFALRIAERTQGAGVTLLRVHPALKARIKPEWLAELERRTGRGVRVETDPGLALEAPQAQIISL